MKIKLLTLILALFSFLAYTQTTSVPDPNFENYLETHDSSGNVVPVGDSSSMGDGTNGNGLVTTSKISGVTTLDVHSLGIGSLLGIQDFAALQSLGCHQNSLTMLDLSNNMNLVSVSCYYNQLTSLLLPPTNTLDRVDCYNNLNLSSLDVTQNPSLTTLLCYNMNLSSLDLHNNTMLDVLICHHNNLMALDLTYNDAITNLQCYNNQLNTLTVTNLTNLIYLRCYFNNITNLDASQNDKLQQLWCYSDYGNNTYPGLNTLTMPASAPDLVSLRLNNNHLSSINLQGYPELTELELGGNNLNSIDLQYSNLLTELQIWENNLTQLVLTNNTGLIYLDCYYNQLTFLNVSPCSLLYYLDAGSNGFTDGDLSNLASNPGLKELYLWDNSFTSLNVSSNMMLEIFSCGGNPNISSVTLPNTSTLYAFWAFGNGFTDLSFLNATNRANLEYFDVGNGQLTSIDVSDIPNLVEFYCNGNASLTSLDISNGNNGILDWMWAQDTALNCIQVDSKPDADSRDPIDHWRKDVTASYEEMCYVAGVDDLALSNISVYPNPSKDKFYIDLQLQANYSLINMYGQSIKKGFLISGINELDAQSLVSGLYLLKIETSEGSTTKKIIKH